MSTWKEKMLTDLQLKGITPRTQKKYLREASLMADYFDKSLEELGEKEVKDYLVHMLETRKLSRGTYRGYVAGIKFLYKTTVPRMGSVALYEHMRIFFISIVVNFPKIQNTFYTCLQIPGKNQNL